MTERPQPSQPDGAEGPLSASLLDAAVELMGRSGRAGRVRVCGRSMLPTLRPDDELAVDFSAHAPRFGELIVFRQHGALIVHRCLGRARRGGWRSRGDGVSAFDPAISAGRLVGRVVAARLDGVWRGFDDAPARGWARAVALHDLCWGGAAVVARAVDRVTARLGAGRPLGRLVNAADRHLLGLAHGLTFERCHRATTDPPG